MTVTEDWEPELPPVSMSMGMKAVRATWAARAFSKPVMIMPVKMAEIIKNGMVKPEDVAFVGDSDVDMMTAKNAGMLPIGVSWGYRSAEVLQNAGAAYIAEDAEDLYRIIKSLI